jgi:hypothetical protein
MPNALGTIVAAPNSIRSGDATTLTITYEASQAGQVEFRCAAPFTISPLSASLAPDPDGRRSLTLTIRRNYPHAGPRRCDVLATFFASSLHFFVEVQ